jgi:hypothetical protein
MEINFKNLRIKAEYPAYPPYHSGPYLEEFFYDYYKKNKSKFDSTGYTLIPIFWTNVYITNINRNLIQPYLDCLPAGKYFTVSQHDDAVAENLPLNTKSFCAGGRNGGIPIPLICSTMSHKPLSAEKDIFCSFVGTLNFGNNCRQKLYDRYINDKDFYFTKPRLWDQAVKDEQFNEFINITSRSQFTLCPRGYGYQSFRFYEVLQLNSIPVFVYNPEFFPFDDIINYDKFCVRVHENDIDSLKDILLNISEERKTSMLEEGKKVYNEFFTLEKVCDNILRILSKYSNID